MRMNVTFKETKHAFIPQFGEVHNVSDGGYERGYAEGYEVGKADGYTDGQSDGVDQGYAIAEDAFINRTLKSARSETATSLGAYLFQNCTMLAEIYFPTVTTTGDGTFQGCKALQHVELPSATRFGNYCFRNCSALKSAYLPKLTYLQNYGFHSCSMLESVYAPLATVVDDRCFESCHALQRIDLPLLTQVKGYAFINASTLKCVILRAGTVATLAATQALDKTPIASGTGYIYVPAALVNSYKSATNWSTFANQFRALEDYTVDGTVTGELDESKI